MFPFLFIILCLLLNPGIFQQSTETLSSRTVDENRGLKFATGTRVALKSHSMRFGTCEHYILFSNEPEGNV